MVLMTGINLFVADQLRGNNSSRFSSNSEALASELVWVKSVISLADSNH